MEILAPQRWTALERAHADRLAPWVSAHLARRGRGEEHPVLDFLFSYYSQSPAKLLRWHPGVGRVLLGADERLDWPLYTRVGSGTGGGAGGMRGTGGGGVGLDVEAFLTKRGAAVRHTADLLRATAGRPGQFGCFGLHEWAMVYRPAAGELRHSSVPLRLGQRGTDGVVEAHRITCSHHDAFRFFTPAGAPRNELAPSRDTQLQLEQPGCLHATMDLYKWAYKLAPAVPGELLADCFVLAADVRVLDMRASPYDLADLGYPPVPIETPAGRRDYVAAQRRFAERAAPLRARLLDVCDALLPGRGRDLPQGRKTRDVPSSGC